MKMNVNIWSDVRCPFCYIGKLKFETALHKFAHKENVNVIWKSFQLDPTLETKKGVTVYDYFSQTKGIPREEAEQLFNNVTQAAQEIGLTFNLESSVVANSFHAHRLIQFAKTKDRGNEIEEALFKAHFTEGKNIDDKEVLSQIATGIGLDKNEVDEVISSTAYEEEVKQDQLQAQKIGVRGVPFFTFNDKYAVSGAQSSETFLQVLEKSWEEFKNDKKELITINGERCSADGNCEE